MKKKSIFDGWVCPHSKYMSPLDQLINEIQMVLDGKPQFILPILGESRTGKSTLLTDVETYFSKRLSTSGHPLVMRLSMPPAASNEALAVKIIKKLLDDETHEVKGKPYQIMDRARVALKEAGVLLLLLEELNHQVEKNSTARAQTKENRAAADWMKELYDESSMSIVLSGLPHVKRLYLDNNQLENRGLRAVMLTAYSWSKPPERDEFVSVVGACLEVFEESGWRIEAKADLIARVTYYGSGGYVGLAMDFFKRIDTASNGNLILSEASLQKAYNDKFTVDWPNEDGDFSIFYDDLLLQKAFREAGDRARASGRRGAQS